MATNSAKRITTVVAVVLGLAAVGFLVRSLVDQWSQVRHAVTHADLGLLALGLVLAGVAMAHLARLWGRSLALFGARPPVGQVVVWWFVGELGKYVPGGILSIVGRAEAARRGGTARAAAYGSVPLSLALRYFAGMLSFAVLVPFDVAHQRSLAAAVVVALVPLGLLALHPRFVEQLLRLSRRVSGRPLELPIPSWGRAIVEVLVYVPNWALIIASTWCTARAFTPDVGLLSVALATLVSWTVGFLVFPVPAGAGLREAVFTRAAGLPMGLGATIAIASRVLFIVVDATGAACSLPRIRRESRAQPVPSATGTGSPT